MQLRLVDYVLWSIVPFVLAGIVVAMYRRGMHRSYPYFFVYAASQALSTLIMAATHEISYVVYYYSYYCDLIVSDLLAAAVIWDVIRRVFVKRPLRPSTSVFLCLCATIILIAAVGSAMNTGRSTLNDVLLLFDRLERLAQVLLVVAIILIGRYFAVSRNSFVFGVVFGFGAFAFVNAVVFTGLSHYGVLSSVALSRINALAYLFACFVWLYYSIYGTTDLQRFDRSQLGEPAQEDIRKSITKNRWFFRTSYAGATQER